MKVQLSQKQITTFLLAVALPAFSSVVLASGTHDSSGHGAIKKMESQGHDEGGHGHSEIDYSKVEQHSFGKASDPKHAEKTISIDMLDKLRFSPAAVHVKRGETVRFVVMNSGKLKHEMVLGTDESLKQHAAMMTKFPGMEHDEPHMAHVAPGKQFAMGWQFTEAGTFHFGCLVPGHYEAGMKGTVVVQ